MARHKMTSKILAEKLGVSEKTVSNWRNGRTEVPASKLLAMSKLFNCTVDYLLATDAQG
jgi:transcriptional regulator with XRE-family HTH domain